MPYTRNRPGARAIRLAAALLVPLLALLAPAAPASAALQFATGVTGFTQELVVGGLPFATGIAFAADGRMFVAQKSGVVRVVQNGALLATPFIDISAIVNDTTDRGLLSIALHPSFPDTPYVYLLYSHDPPGVVANGPGARVSQLMRVTADPAFGYNVALATGRVVLLGTNSTRANIGNESNGQDTAFASCMAGGTPSGAPIEDCIPSDENSHSIGTVAFAPDGSLFVSSGDGSNYGGVDPRALRSQNVDSLSGKIIRIDPDTGLGLPSNPFYQPANPGSNRSKVWAYGLRNPFRIAIHPVSSEPYIGDVGWNTWEEINTGKGANFGWPCYEGGVVSGGGAEGGNTTSLVQGSYQANTATSAACAALYASGLGAVQRPVFAYNRSLDGYLGSGGAAATAGAFYTGTAYPAQYRNTLFIVDYNRQWIRYLTFDTSGNATISNFARESTSSVGPVQVVQGPDTNLYVVLYNSTGSEVRRIRYTGGTNTPPTAVAAADAPIGAAPHTVSFSSLGSFDPDAQPISYSWNFADGTTSTSANPSKTFTQAGVYHVQLTVAETTSPFASSTATVRVTVGTNPPIATINAPLGGTYAVGDTISYNGSASASGQPIPPQNLSWELRQHHNQHLHYDTLGTGASGSFVVTEHGDATSYTLCLTATATGPGDDVSDTRCVDLTPRKTDIHLESEPPGIIFDYQDEGIQVSSPAIISPIVNSQQTISVSPVQNSRSFVQWSDGITATERTFTTGTTERTFTALFVNKPPQAAAAATPTAGGAPLAVTFSGAGSSDAEDDALTFAWSFGDGITSTLQSPAHTYAAPGSYTATLTVTDRLGASDSAAVTLEVGDTPVPNIGAPTATQYSASEQISVAGSAADYEDGAVAASGLRWDIIRHSGGVTTTLASFTGAGGTFTAPDSGVSGATAQGVDEAIEVRLRATDSDGRRAVVSRTLTPRVAALSVSSGTPGVAITYQAALYPLPFTRYMVVGSVHEVVAPASQGDLPFAGWLGLPAAGAASTTATVTVPAQGAQLVARYGSTEVELFIPIVQR